MAYSAYTDVIRETGVSFTVSTNPTTASITEFIADIDSEINAILRRAGFDVTSVTFLTTGDTFLRRVSTAGAAWKAMRALYQAQGYNDTEQVDRFERDYQRMIDELKADPNSVLNSTDENVTRVDGQPNTASDTAVYPEAYFQMTRTY